MSECSAIILAAGMSQRMGAVNKLLVPIDGMPMVRRSVLAYLEACDGEVLVVTGHQQVQVREALKGLTLRFTHNPEFVLGRKTSVAAGLTAARLARYTLIGLGDQPFLNPCNLSALLAVHRFAGGQRITVPVQGKWRGNPLIVPAALRTQLLADRCNPGCHRFTRDNPHLVNHVTTHTSAFFHDLDTRADLQALSPEREDAI